MISLLKERRRRSLGLRASTSTPRFPGLRPPNKEPKSFRVKWVIVNKGDAEHVEVRCRLVAKEFKAKTKESLLAHELFAAMPPGNASRRSSRS